MLKLKKIKPMYSGIVTTKHVYEADSKTPSGIIDSSKLAGTLKEYQRVIAVGDMVRNIKEGDLVCIDPSRYVVKKYEENSIKNDLMENKVIGYNFPTVTLDNKEYLLLTEQDIRFIVEDYEEEKESIINIPEKKIIV